jgi:hypothetical protein
MAVNVAGGGRFSFPAVTLGMLVCQVQGILTERDSIDAQQTFSSLGALSTDEHEAVRTRPCGSSAPRY